MHPNPDRDFSTERVGQWEELRTLLPGSEIAAEFDAAARDRVGRIIGQAVLRYTRST
jgi:hypothetical protein